MSTLKIRKVTTLPGTLEPSTLYMQKDGTNLALYLTDSAGSLSYKTYGSTEVSNIFNALISAIKGQPDGIAGINLSGVIEGDITGNAATATELQEPRQINGVFFDGTGDIIINAVDSTARIAATEKGAANGVATLDAGGKVPTGQLPSFVDDVLEYTNLATFPVTGETGKIYVALDTNKTYRWSGSAYIYITSGAVDSVAGKTGAVTLVKADVGLSNVDNTSDANKPVSTAQSTAISNAQAAAIAASAPSAHVGATGAAHGVVTTSVNGFMSSTDKTKLDAITGTNTGDQTNITGNAGTATALQTARNINGVPFNGTTDITITANYDGVVSSTDTSDAASETLRIYRADIANRQFLAYVDPNSGKYPLSSLFSRRKTYEWTHGGNSNTTNGYPALSALTIVGTGTARSVSIANSLTMTKRVGLVSAGSAGSLASYRIPAAQHKIGGGDNLGGFFWSHRFGISDASIVANARMFLGLRNTTSAATNVSPATITNCIGIGHDAGHTNLRIYFGGSAAQTPIDLGANFPVNNTTLYEASFYSPRNASVVYYQVINLSTGAVAEGQLTGAVGTAIPATNSLLTLMNSFRTNNTTAAAVGIDIVSIYMETDT